MRKLAQGYVYNTDCTSSRTELITGAYAERIGMDERALCPGKTRGLHPDEIATAAPYKASCSASG
jgi:hypothetical protein